MMKNAKKILFSLVLFLWFWGLFAAVSLCLGFSGLFPDLRQSLTETFTISRGTRFIVSFFQEPDTTRTYMENSLYKTLLPLGQTRGDFADPDGFDREASLSLYGIRGFGYRGWCVLVRDPGLIRLAVTPALGQNGLQPGQYNALTPFAAALNAGGYMDNDTLLGRGGVPAGVVIRDGVPLTGDWNRTMELIGFDDRDVLICGSFTQKQALEDMKIRDAVSFRPLLVQKGQGVITSGTGGYGYAPRSAIGQRRDGTVILLMLEGRRLDGLGATLLDVQNILLHFDAYTGALLDGGSCSCLYYDGKRQSRTVDFFGERPVPDMFCVPFDRKDGGK